MNLGPNSDYRAGLFWLLVGGGFVDVFPSFLGLLWVGSGLWLMLQRETPPGG
jgi:hypothetical protein